jgi:cyclase
MSKIICDVCGTSYPETATQCPICGCVRPGDAKSVKSGVSGTSSGYTYVKGGRCRTDVKLYDWVKEACDRGAGEILFTSMDNDGTHSGYALEPLSVITSMVDVPVIASGGAGSLEHFYEAFAAGGAQAALAAGLFHYGQLTIPQVKKYLSEKGIEVRL